MSLQRDPIDSLAEDFVRRSRLGERPSITEYVAAHPQLASSIRDLFPALVAIEQLKEAPLNALGPPRDGCDKPPERVGDCRILREIGRGGMGVVYEAVQESLGRRVAVKVLQDWTIPNEKHLHRFLRESRNTAKLHHSNIVSVFGVGHDAGLHYFVMQYIRGVGLDKVLVELNRLFHASSPAGPAADAPPPNLEAGNAAESHDLVSSVAIAERWIGGSSNSKIRQEQKYWRSVAAAGLQVAEALDYAHGRGIVHRDIKPGNLLIDEHGVVWVTDFGLAKTLSPSGSHPGHDIVGTIRYMAPEQFLGECDPRCDVYSLGLTLYEMLTLRPAYMESDLTRLVHAISTTDAPAPRALRPHIPLDLEAIVKKAMARDPRRRYSNASVLVDDLRRFLEDKPIRARPIPVAERIGKFARRNPALTALSTLLAATSIAGFVIISWKWRDAERENRRAEYNLAQALDAMDEMLNVFATTWMAHPAAPQSDDDRDDLELRMVASHHSARIHQIVLKFYNRFAAENVSNPRLRRDMAGAHTHVAEILQRLGHLAEAEAAHREALAIYDDLTEENPKDSNLARDAAAAWNNLGRVLRELARYSDAEKAHTQARELLLPFVGGAQRSTACCYELARTCSDLGGVMSRLGHVRQGREQLRHGMQLLDELILADGERPHYLVAKARCCVSLYRSMGFEAYSKKTHPLINTALANLEQLVQQYPDVPDYQIELAEVLASLGVWGYSEETLALREPLIRRAIEMAEQLSTAYPNIPRYRACLARALHGLAQSLHRNGRTADSEAPERRAAELYRRLTHDFPGVDAYHSFSALASFCHGEILRERDQLAESRAALEESVARQQEYLARRPDDRFRKRTLGRHFVSLAETLRRLGEVALAAETEQKAEKLGGVRRPAFSPRRDRPVAPRPVAPTT